MANNSNTQPTYETASLKIQNEARKRVIKKAERMAKEFQEKKGGEVVEEIEEEEAAEKEN